MSRVASLTMIDGEFNYIPVMDSGRLAGLLRDQWLS